MYQAAAIVTSSRGNYDMLKHYINSCDALLRLSTDEAGVVSLEYVIVAACVVAVVIAAFSTGGSLPGALTSGFTAITTAMAAL
jgi:pilus assembly protein Flp/PilA